MKTMERKVRVQLRKNSSINQEPSMVIVRYIAIDSFAISDEMWFFNCLSSGMYSHDLHRVTLKKELREFFQET